MPAAKYIFQQIMQLNYWPLNHDLVGNEFPGQPCVHSDTTRRPHEQISPHAVLPRCYRSRILWGVSNRAGRWPQLSCLACRCFLPLQLD